MQDYKSKWQLLVCFWAWLQVSFLGLSVHNTEWGYFFVTPGTSIWLKLYSVFNLWQEPIQPRSYIASNVCFRHCLNIFLISNPHPRPVVQPSSNDKAPRKQEIKFSKLRFRGNSKIPSDTQRQGPSFKFGQAPHFETELNKIRNNFDLRRGGEPTFLERISNFFQPISRIMSHPWKWSDLSGHNV